MKQYSPISLYIHLPYCASKCRYCDFVSVVGDETEIIYYLRLLEKEIGLYRNLMNNRSIKTIFFGGGTPSLISGQEMKRLMRAIKDAFNIMPEAEISVEANPGQMDSCKLHDYRESGINRISFGLQAIQDPLLKILGRRHNAEVFSQQIMKARQEGFRNINADVIFGIPGQDMEDWIETIHYLTSMEVPHLSCYGLTYEEGTRLFQMMKAGIIDPLDEDLEWLMFRKTIEILQGRGYVHYEISNYSKPGYQCRHNLAYWRNEEYLALGMAAHGYLNGIRYQNTEEFKDYESMLNQKTYPVSVRDRVSEDEFIKETMFLGLRLREGISLKEFQKKHNQSCLRLFDKEIQELIQQKLLWKDKDRIKLTEKGFDLANKVLVRFV